MVDCACTNFPAGLGNVTIGASLGIGTTTPGYGYKLDVQGGVTRLKGTATDVLHLDAPATGYPTTALVKFREHSGSERWWFGAGLGGEFDPGFGLYGFAGVTPGYRLYASANGNVGIGRNNPLAVLHVNGSLVAEGNTGIGTSAPLYRLDVQGGTTRLKGLSYDALYLDAPGPSTPTTVLIRFRGSDQTPRWMFGMGLGGPGDEGFGLYGEAGATPGYRLYALPNGDVGIGTNGPQARLHVAGNLVADGNVGIGTTTPSAPLTVRTAATASAGGQLAAQLQAAHDGTVVGSGAVLRFADAAGTTVGQLRSITEGQGQIGLAFSTFYSTGVGERVRISAAGNVGIGTTSPISRLHVQGTFTAEGSITASNGPISTTGGYDITSSGKYYARISPTQSRLIADGSGCYFA